LNIIVEKNGNDINVLFDGNINIGINGEMGIVSTKNISIDTLNSKLYLNSRKSPSIKNNQESLDYIKQSEKLLKKKQFLIDHEYNSLIKRIEKLEELTRGN
jgi:hypothetical protein